MSEFLFGFTTGLSFILAIGAQNLFVIEQGIKKNHIFLITTICAFSDFLLIFLTKTFLKNNFAFSIRHIDTCR